MKLITGLLIATSALAAAQAMAKKPTDSPVTYQAPFIKKAPKIDGIPSDSVWIKAPWRDMPYLITGSAPTDANDLSARYKVVWSKKHLYILAEISDDILVDSHPNPLHHYWDDDALEIFIDQDNSGGRHLFNYNAFAYHVSLDNQAVDLGPFLTEADKKAEKANVRTYPEHIRSQWKRSQTEPHKIYWEVELAVYPDTYKDVYEEGEKPVKPVKLRDGDKLGFMMSYCDSDGPNGRDHFIGDIDIPAVNGDKNRGYITADVFGVLELVK